MKCTITTCKPAKYRLPAVTGPQTGSPRSRHTKTSAAAQGKPLSTWLLLANLYMTQFMGLSFFMIALVVIMRRQGMPLERLGGIYLLGLFWVIKFLWAPLVDRFGIKRMGHYRSWLLLTQTGMMLSLFAISFLDIATQFGAVLGGCVVLAVFSSTQDIAADGLVCCMLSREERGLGSGIQYAGGMLGNLVGGGAVLMAYPHIGWKGSMLVLGLFTLVSWFQVLCFREPDHNTEPQANPLLLARFLTFWKIPGHGQWLLLLALVRIATATGATALAGKAGYFSAVMAAWAFACLSLVLSLFFKLSLTNGGKEQETVKEA